MKRKPTIILWLIILAMFILDTKTMQLGVQKGIQMCLVTLIPALFPFLLLSSLLTSDMFGMRLPFSKIIAKLLRIPREYISIFILGLLGGYPVGARCICQATERGSLQATNGKRMLCFCSNAGPSFIFGMGIALFSDVRLCWLIWLIQLLSAFLMALLTPGNCTQDTVTQQSISLSLPQALQKAVSTMAMICGWVILFRVMIAYLSQWVMWLLPDLLQMILIGTLELANGCSRLQAIQNEGTRFVLFSAFLGFGGLCVAMQTTSFTSAAGLDSRWYFPAKLCQGALAGLLAALVYPGNTGLKPSWLLLCAIPVVCYPVFLGKQNPKNTTGIYKPVGV